MKPFLHTLLIPLFAFALSACAPGLHPNQSLELSQVTENSVQVTISIHQDEADTLTLSATFTPLEPGLHLYSKDIPKTGVNGLGRPALLEIETSESLQMAGQLMESVPAGVPNFDPQELLVYPPGVVTLSVLIHMADTKAHTETVYVTYMACNEQGCRAPVEHRAIEITIPQRSSE